MITITKPKESRQRDVNRNRVLLTIGSKKWHITQSEAKAIRNQIDKILESPKSISPRDLDI
jgi:hypothetical protein